MIRSILRRIPGDVHLFLIATTVAAVCLFNAIDSYPIYFFCDEALHVVEAQKLLDTGTDRFGKAWPVFLEAFGMHELSLSVYLQMPFNYLFGFNEIAPRIRSGFCSVLLGIFLSLLTRPLTRIRVWWLWPLALVISSFWYLHSRTGFQLSLAGLCYGVFIISYLCWRERTSNWHCLAIAAVAAALGCYSYTATRGWVFCTTVLFLLLDWRLLLKSRKEVIKGVSPGILFMIPFAAVMIAHPDWLLARYHNLANSWQLHAASESWIENTYNLLSPGFWFGRELQLTFDGGERHRVAGLAYFPTALMPFFGIGFVISLLKRSVFPRFHIAAIALSGVFPAVTLEINPLRCLPVWFAIVILIFEGTNWVLEKCIQFSSILKEAGGGLVLAFFALISVYQHAWAVVSSPSYVTDYDGGGLQFGALELGQWMKENSIHPSRVRLGLDIYLQPHITTAVVAGTDFGAYRYLVPGSLCSSDVAETDLADRSALWVTRLRSDKLIEPGCPVTAVVRKIISTPTGIPSLYVYSLEAGSSLKEYLDQKKFERRNLRDSVGEIEGIPVNVRHNESNLGSIAEIFDGKQQTLMRTRGVNPAVLEITVPEALRKRSWILSVSHSRYSVVAVIPSGQNSRPCKQEGVVNAEPPVVNFLCDTKDLDVPSLTFVVTIFWAGADSPVHISELSPVKP